VREILVEQVMTALDRDRPVIVCLAGPVGIGKTTLAERIALDLRAAGVSAVTLSTDGFLLRNVELDARGLLERKGFPETYDVAALLDAVKRFRRGDTCTVPVYSHATFDADDERTLEAAEVLVVEGVNALQPDIAAAADLCWYLDAPDDAVVSWFVHRFVGLTERARSSGGFYERFADLEPAALERTARWVWSTINQPNLDVHIRPTRDRADLVVDAAALRSAG
jgi:type I pantothenate kinase